MKKIIALVLFAACFALSRASTTALLVNDPVTLSVTSDGTAPFSYQWYFQNIGGSAQPIVGATQSTYRIASLKSTDAGTYTVIVSNSAGSVKSDDAVLTVGVPVLPPTKATTSSAKK